MCLLIIESKSTIGHNWKLLQALCNGANEMWGMRINMQAFIKRQGQNTGRVKQMAKKYIEGKAEE